jgi:PAT family acetyl-CoA transporter-like MFS transporter 1
MSLGLGLKRTYFSTLQMGFAVTDAATGLKLIEAGVPKETLAMLAVPMIPLQITLPWIVSRYASGTDGGMFKHTPRCILTNLSPIRQSLPITIHHWT